MDKILSFIDKETFVSPHSGHIYNLRLKSVPFIDVYPKNSLNEFKMKDVNDAEATTKMKLLKKLYSAILNEECFKHFSRAEEEKENRKLKFHSKQEIFSNSCYDGFNMSTSNSKSDKYGAYTNSERNSYSKGLSNEFSSLEKEISSVTYDLSGADYLTENSEICNADFCNTIKESTCKCINTN